MIDDRWQMPTNSSSDLRSAITHLRAFISEAEEQVDNLGLNRRAIHRYPFDTVAAQFLRKSFSLAKAVLLLLEHEQPDEAFGLSRSLVEAAISLRYMTQDPEKTAERVMAFVHATVDDRNLWLYWSLRRYAGTPTENQIKRLAEERGLEEDSKGAYSHWSGERQFIRTATDMVHPLDPSDIDEDYNRMARAADYHFVSNFVHCSEVALEWLVDLDEPQIVVSGKQQETIDTGRRAVVIVFQYLKQVILYCLTGMNAYIPHTFTVLNRHRFDEQMMRYREWNTEKDCWER